MIKVLYVEDDPDDILVVREFLRGSDDRIFSLECARSVRHAETCLRVQNYDLILVDYLLGSRCDHVTGTAQQLLQKLSARGVSCPVILLTGFEREMLDLQTLSLVSTGRMTYLSKADLTQQTLLAEIEKLLQQQHTALIIGAQASDGAVMQEAVNLVSSFPVRVHSASNAKDAYDSLDSQRYQYLFVDSDCDCEQPIAHGADLISEVLSSNLAQNCVLISDNLRGHLGIRVHRLVESGRLSVASRALFSREYLVRILLQMRDRQQEDVVRAASLSNAG